MAYNGINEPSLASSLNPISNAKKDKHSAAANIDNKDATIYLSGRSIFDEIAESVGSSRSSSSLKDDELRKTIMENNLQLRIQKLSAKQREEPFHQKEITLLRKKYKLDLAKLELAENVLKLELLENVGDVFDNFNK